MCLSANFIIRYVKPQKVRFIKRAETSGGQKPRADRNLSGRNSQTENLKQKTSGRKPQTDRNFRAETSDRQKPENSFYTASGLFYLLIFRDLLFSCLSPC